MLKSDDNRIFLEENTYQMNYTKLFEKADALYEQNKIEEAKELYRTIMLSNGDTHAALMYGNCLSLQNEHESAIKIFKRLTEITPYEEAPWYNLGNQYLKLDRPAKALMCFRKAKEADSKNADAEYKMGFCHERLNNVEQATEHYKRSLEFEVSDNTLFRLGICYLMQNNADKALECLTKANELEPDCYDTNFYIGLCYENLKNPDKAIKYYKKALKIENNFNAHLNLGACYRDIGNLDSALKHSKTAYEMNPGDPDALHYYCYILIKTKNGNKAYNLLCATDIDFSDDYSLLEMLIVLSLNRGDFSRANKAYLKLKKIDTEMAFDYETLKEKAQKKFYEKNPTS